MESYFEFILSICIRYSSWIVQNAELFTLTYGAIVRQLLTDLEEVEEVNKQLDQMYNSETPSLFKFNKFYYLYLLML